MPQSAAAFNGLTLVKSGSGADAIADAAADDGTEMKGQKATGESDDTPDLPRKARHVPPMEIAAPSNGLKKIS